MNQFLKLGLNTLKYKLLKKKTLTNLMISVTNRCNSQCIYCAIPSRSAVELSKQELFTIIEEFKINGGSRISLWGGEPLIRSDIGDLIDFCKNKNLLVSLDTNGYYISDKLHLLQNLDLLVVSFDGPQIIHDELRGFGSYDKALEGLKLTSKRQKVWSLTVLTKKNINSIDFILNKADEIGFQTFWQVLHHQNLAPKGWRDLLPSQEEHSKVFKYLIKKKKEGWPIVNSYDYFKYLLKWQDFKNSYTFKPSHKNTCYAGKLYANLDTNGDLYPCSTLVGLMPSINIKGGNLNNSFQKLDSKICNYCNAGCYIEYNQIYKLNPKVVFNWIKLFK